MIVLVWLAIAIQTPETQPTDGVVVTRQENRLSIPPEIAPAVIPYVQCVMNAMNEEAEVAPIATADAARAAQQRALATCQATRNEAKAAALKILSRSSAVHGDTEGFVESALTSIDHINDKIAERLDQANSSQHETAN